MPIPQTINCPVGQARRLPQPILQDVSMLIFDGFGLVQQVPVQ
jgi:hypothetical protein